jgi:hypothetical protein
MARRKKNLLGTLDLNEKHYECSRWEMWPPTEILIHEDPLEVRAELGDAAYHRVQVWQSACGLMKMSADKCPSCPYVEIDGVINKAPGGGFHIPRTIQATRKAWEKRRREKEES